MHTDVCVHIRRRCAAQQAETHHAAERRVAVAAVGKQRDAKSRFRQVGPAMAGYFELGKVGIGVGMGRTLDGAEHRLVGGMARLAGKGKYDFRQGPPFVPVDLRIELEMSAGSVETDNLQKPALLAERAFEFHLRAQWTAHEDRAAVGWRCLATGLQRERVYVPRFIFARAVVEENEAVCRFVECLAPRFAMNER